MILSFVEMTTIDGGKAILESRGGMFMGTYTFGVSHIQRCGSSTCTTVLALRDPSPNSGQALFRATYIKQRRIRLFTSGFSNFIVFLPFSLFDITASRLFPISTFACRGSSRPHSLKPCQASFIEKLGGYFHSKNACESKGASSEGNYGYHAISAPSTPFSTLINAS